MRATGLWGMLEPQNQKQMQLALKAEKKEVKEKIIWWMNQDHRSKLYIYRLKEGTKGEQASKNSKAYNKCI